MASKKALGLAMGSLLLMKGVSAQAGGAMAALESAASDGTFAMHASSMEGSKWSSSLDFEDLRDAVAAEPRSPEGAVRPLPKGAPAAVPIGAGRTARTYATRVPPTPKPVVVAVEKKAAPPPPPPAHPGATRGAAVGMAIGLLLGLLFGPIGAIVGALIGAVIGAAIGRMRK